MNARAGAHVYVVIVNFNSVSHLERCLAALPPRDNLRVIVWDNGSTDAEVSQLRILTRARADVTLAESSENLGFGPAVNRAVESLDAQPEDLIWILNPDTEMVGDAIATMVSGFVTHPQLKIVSPLITSSRTDRIWFAGGIVDCRRGKSTHADIGQPVENLGVEPIPTQFVTGAAPMMRIETWKRLRGFREDLFLYWEDADLSLRAMALGFSAAVLPTAIVRHAEGGSSGSVDGRSLVFYYYASRNRLIACGEGFGQRLSILLMRGGFESMRQIALIVVRERHERFRKLVAWCRGSLDGLRGKSGVR